MQSDEHQLNDLADEKKEHGALIIAAEDNEGCTVCEIRHDISTYPCSLKVVFFPNIKREDIESMTANVPKVKILE